MSPTRRKPNAMWAPTVKPLLGERGTVVPQSNSTRERLKPLLCLRLAHISGCDFKGNPKSYASLFDFNEKRGASRLSCPKPRPRYPLP